MQQERSGEAMDSGQPEYVTLLAVQREVGATRETLKKYRIYLEIEPTCFHIGTRSLSISREAMGRVKQLKQNPALLPRLKSPTGGQPPQENSPNG